MDAQEHLRHSYELKTKAQEKTSEVMNKLNESRKNVQKMLHEKRNFEMELENKEQESQLLCTMQEKDVHHQVPLDNIEKGKREIQSLKEELQRRESELESALQDVQIKQEQLLQAQKEIKKQHEEVIMLQRKKEKLACSYNIEIENVSKLVQIFVSGNEERKVR